MSTGTEAEAHRVYTEVARVLRAAGLPEVATGADGRMVRGGWAAEVTLDPMVLVTWWPDPATGLAAIIAAEEEHGEHASPQQRARDAMARAVADILDAHGHRTRPTEERDGLHHAANVLVVEAGAR